VKPFIWDPAKNEKLLRERGISFEDIVFHIEKGDILDILEHPREEKYTGQKLLVVQVNDYAYLVPFLEEPEQIVLKTIIPSRKATKIYLRSQ
jgi:uncharacterized DUF497 family protein